MSAIIQFFQGILTLGGAFDWSIVKQYVFDPLIIQGAEITIILAVISQLAGCVIGLILYLLRRSKIPVVRGIGEIYVWFFRGTPLLVQLLLIFGVFEEFHLVRFITIHDNLTSLGFDYRIHLVFFIEAFIAFGLNEGAYMAEIVRAGIDSIDVGQTEAAKSLGMSYGLSMRRIILPQAMRIIIPPLGNEFNSMLKTTSLAATIGLAELYFWTAQFYGFPSFRPLEFGVVASIWYLAMTSVWSIAQSYIERYFNASNIEKPSGTWWQRLTGFGSRKPPEQAAEEVLIGAHAR